MKSQKRSIPLTKAVLGVMVLLFSVMTFSWGCKKAENVGIDLAPFIEMARNEPCADVRNRLFVIDDEMVLSDQAGTCPDYSYHITLFGNTVDQVLCRFYDSIAGPVKIIYNEDYCEMFEIIINNLDKTDLGLGPNHKVEIVAFGS